MIGRLALEEISALDPEVQEAAMPALMRLRQRLDYETYGGAQLLGVKGVVVIAHGSSSRVAIANALEMARDGAERDLPGRLATELAS
jgi:glycerol-3-phosphate acyltransferase PlsX